MGDKKLLDGKEFEQKIGEVGNVSIDVDSDLNVKIEVVIETVQAGVTIKSSNSASAPLLSIIEAACLKNNITWDESLIAGVKLLLKMA